MREYPLRYQGQIIVPADMQVLTEIKNPTIKCTIDIGYNHSFQNKEND